MKSVLQAVNLLTVAFGNVIVIIVAEAKAFDQVGLYTFVCTLVLEPVNVETCAEAPSVNFYAW